MNLSDLKAARENADVARREYHAAVRAALAAGASLWQVATALGHNTTSEVRRIRDSE